MDMISSTSKIRQNQGIMMTELDGDVIMVNAELGEYYILDGIASDIWRRLSKEMHVDDLVSQLVDSYDGTQQTIAEDTYEFLKDLKRKGALIIEP